jgi:subtilisin family serine protease
MRRLALLFIPAFLAACQDAPAPMATAADAPALNRAGGEAVPGQYIVVFNDGVADAPGLARRMVAAEGGTLLHTYQHSIRGFSARLSASAAEALARNPSVAYVEQDQVVSIGSTTQTNATWGIDRVDQRDLPLSTTYTYANTGAGVRAYILDTGIRYSHVEFAPGRATFGFDAFGGDGNDCNGHGTHVAGTVGGTLYGVAKGASLVAVRVLDCRGSGTTGGVIAGVDWVTANHVKPAVANMSLGGGASTALDDAVRASVAAGVTYSLAAGNGDFLGRPQDACNSSPARVAEGLTVGSTTSTDNESSFSNYGTCVNVLAPGSSITSAWYQSDTETRTISGTSMAAPHVAGAAALYLNENPGATPAQVGKALIDNATIGRITLHSRSTSGGTPNRLVYTAFVGGGGDPGDPGDPVEPPPADGIALSANAYKVKGFQQVDLSWAGASGSSVDVYRDGSKIATTANSGAYTDELGVKGSGSYVYRVCEAGTSTCSGNVTAAF